MPANAASGAGEKCDSGCKKPVLPNLRADLLLVHAPAFFEFRNRRDIYFPFLGTSGDVPITPLYEYFPIGFKMFERFLSDRGHDIKILNLSTLLLRYPRLDFDAIVDALDVRLLGIDLHWMIHVQGSLAVAERIRRRRSDIKVVFGGISATYYADELIRYPFIDMVLRGYDTLAPMDMLLGALRRGGPLREVPNLVWKEKSGDVRWNKYTHVPRTYGVGVDWANLQRSEVNSSMPILEFLSTQNAGCAYNCGWCGGSRDAFKRVFGVNHSMARKTPEEVRSEFTSITEVPDRNRYHFYSVGSYNESRSGMDAFLDEVARAGVKSISYEQFHLTPEPVLRKMVAANKNTAITLSPESHDQWISRLSGRGVYSNDELERWLERALEIGISNIDIWYFVGMPEQDEKSVMETVEYCVRLLELFRGQRVNPMLCPMIPLLDPASTFFTDPEPHGYRVFYHSVEEHRRGAERASIINRINYETRWLRRSDLVYVGFEAVRRLMRAKADNGALPRGAVNGYNARIADAVEMIRTVHEADCILDPADRARELEKLGDAILERNDQIFFHGVANQAFPVNRQIGGRWFDETGWRAEVLELAMAEAANASAAVA
jgi:clorobiocin biosynthesis protein CloN6